MLRRTSRNLVVNPSFNDKSGWKWDGGVYDEAVFRRPGSNSVRLHGALAEQVYPMQIPLLCRNAQRLPLANGIYFYRLSGVTIVQVKRVLWFR